VHVGYDERTALGLIMNILVTGGAGFVGSSIALALKQERPRANVCVFDNLRRRGSELALERLRRNGVVFVHGDVRNPADLLDAGAFDVLIECSAEPSVHAGYSNSPSYVLQTNLVGTIHCLEAARQFGAAVVFLSTSRVYPVNRLRSLPLQQEHARLDIPAGTTGPGWSREGIAREFPLDGHRTIYGATKLASELLIEEYRAAFGLRAIVNRCGVIAGPWQMGKVDQGFVALWAARHLYGGRLSYKGFGGHGHQTRDVLHVLDLCDLVARQIDGIDRYDGRVLNVGGGHERSVSLRELTALCEERTGRTIAFEPRPETDPADVPYYVSDNREVSAVVGWAPQRPLTQVLDDVFEWLRGFRDVLVPLLGDAQSLVETSS
jgi:CDP-paratose 2-epimerase